MQRILICGDRNWNDPNVIYNVLKEFPSTCTVIHGDCRGADRMGAKAALILGMEVLAFPVTDSEWKTYGGYAGPRRNKKMLDEGQPDLVLAFHGDISSSKGTKDMVNQSCNRGVDVILID